ncbi:MAG: hypothetical protein C4581_02515 [Nitrospiraceae bacterium]|nr:MAG: hypothetical protein C4581_02515 [Nitrospiraceae bacterium]
MIKLNCWEIKKCGREPNGKHIPDLGVCPVATDISSNGINSGKNAGRICWDVPHTLCEGKIHDDFSQKAFSCVSCEVFSRVRAEEGALNFSLLKIFHYSQPAELINNSDVHFDLRAQLPHLPQEIIITDSTGESGKYRRTGR